MNVVVTGRNVEVTPALKKYAADKVKKFDRLDAKIMEASFEFSTEKFRHRVEVTLKVNGQIIQAKGDTEEMYASIDEVMDKLSRQLKKVKEKQGSRRKEDRASIKGSVAQEAVEEEANMPRQIIKSERFDPKPMTAEEAAMQLDLLSRDFFVFSNASSGTINVVYRRKDGHVGLIQPGK